MLLAVAIASLTMVAALPAGASQSFEDVEFGSTFHQDIEALAWEGITRGCNPPDNTRFCPDDVVTRGQMAAFLVRALGLTDTGDADFTDDDGSVFETDIERLAAAGITRGCNPPDNTRFCPREPVTRGQMAAFLVRAFDYPPSPLLTAQADGTWDVTYTVTDVEGRPSVEEGQTTSEQWTITYDCADGLCDAVLQRGGGEVDVDVDPDTGLHVIRDFVGRLDCRDNETGDLLFVDGYDTTIFEAFWVAGFAGGGAVDIEGIYELEAFARPAAEDAGCQPYELEVASLTGQK